jgi:hypothetical protein
MASRLEGVAAEAEGVAGLEPGPKAWPELSGAVNWTAGRRFRHYDVGQGKALRVSALR